jgi:hypothetical protein
MGVLSPGRPLDLSPPEDRLGGQHPTVPIEVGHSLRIGPGGRPSRKARGFFFFFFWKVRVWADKRDLSQSP